MDRSYLGASQRAVTSWLKRHKAGGTAADIGRALWTKSARDGAKTASTPQQQLARQWASRVLTSLYLKGLADRDFNLKLKAYVWKLRSV